MHFVDDVVGGDKKYPAHHDRCCLSLKEIGIEKPGVRGASLSGEKLKP